MNPVPSVAVLVSAGVNPISGIARAFRGDAVALAVARKLAGGPVRVIHVGHRDEPALRDYLALGAGAIEVLAAAGDNGMRQLSVARQHSAPPHHHSVPNPVHRNRS